MKGLLHSPPISGTFSADEWPRTIDSLIPISAVATAAEELQFPSPMSLYGLPDFAFLSTKVPKLEHIQVQSTIFPAIGDHLCPTYLPDLQSWEQMHVEDWSLSSPMYVSGYFDVVSFIESAESRFIDPASASSSLSPPPPPPHNHPRGKARRRRPRISIGDRIRILRSLLPSKDRMEMAKTLEETYKYVRFLEAQVTALQLMPPLAPFSAAPIFPSWSSPTVVPPWEGLERLQMLAVLVNSSIMQEKLYKMGLCVSSAEQVAALQRAWEPCHPKVLFLPEPLSAAAAPSDD